MKDKPEVIDYVAFFFFMGIAALIGVGLGYWIGQ